MILQALDGYYHRLAARDEPPVPPYGYSDQPISFALVLSADGQLHDAIPLGIASRRGMDPARMAVPQPVIRASGVAANFLWDKTAYALGVRRDPENANVLIEASQENKASRRLHEEHKAFCDSHEELLAGTDDEGLLALLAFLRSWQPRDFAATGLSIDLLDTNLIFRLNGEHRFLHERPAAQTRWGRALAGSAGAAGLCLVTGEDGPLARLHPPIKGVRGAQSSGARIVSFNLDAFTSFGKDQGANAPVSEQAAFTYTTALNHLLRAGEHNRQKLQIGDATTVFWAEAGRLDEDAAAQAAEDCVSIMLMPPAEEELDAGEAARARDVLDALAKGRPLDEVDPKLNAATRLFVLGLSPNASRLSVRFWCTDTLEALATHYVRHAHDLAIEPRPWKTPPAVWRLLYETAAQRKAENIPPTLAGELLRAILSPATPTHRPC